MPGDDDTLDPVGERPARGGGQQLGVAGERLGAAAHHGGGLGQQGPVELLGEPAQAQGDGAVMLIAGDDNAADGVDGPVGVVDDPTRLMDADRAGREAGSGRGPRRERPRRARSQVPTAGGSVH